jgi:predicted mannosyl-3-phosphoglycerate phosphatase (HAD superfamily)
MGRNNRNNFEKNKKALLVALLEKSKIQLKGSLIEKIKQQKIEENKQYLEDLKKRYSKYPLAYLLSGETEI